MSDAEFVAPIVKAYGQRHAATVPAPVIAHSLSEMIEIADAEDAAKGRACEGGTHKNLHVEYVPPLFTSGGSYELSCKACGFVSKGHQTLAEASEALKEMVK